MVLLPIVIYILLLLPYIGSVPSHDGNTELQFVYNFYNGTYLSNWMPNHPPFRPWFFSTFFHIFGFRSYSIFGLGFGILGIIALYYATEKIFNKKIALMSSLF